MTSALLKLQGPLHLQADAWVDDQDLILEFFEPKRCQPLQLPQKMKGDGLFGTTGAIFHLDGNPEPLPDAAQTLDPTAPPLDSTWPWLRRISSVSNRPSPATRSGWASIARLICSSSAWREAPRWA